MKIPSKNSAPDKPVGSVQTMKKPAESSIQVRDRGGAPDSESIIEFAQRTSGPGLLGNTRWSIVLRAGSEDQEDSIQALGQLYKTYWYPLYAYLRRKGRSHADAEDLLQGLFQHILESDFLQRADPEKGRFRNYLLTALKRFVSKDVRRNSTATRGGGRPAISLELHEAGNRYQMEDLSALSADKFYDRLWAQELLSKVVSRLRENYDARGLLDQFEVLQKFLAWNPQESFPEAAASLGMTLGGFKAAVWRMRKRCGQILYAEVAHTVANPEDLEEVKSEIRSLFSAFASNNDVKIVAKGTRPEDEGHSDQGGD